jgi:hypothetical protein
MLALYSTSIEDLELRIAIRSFRHIISSLTAALLRIVCYL